MTTQLSSDNEQDLIQDPPNIQPSADTMLIPSFQPVSATAQSPGAPSPYYIQEGDDVPDVGSVSSAFATPFQYSSALPTMNEVQATGGEHVYTATAPTPTPSFGEKKAGRSSLFKIALVTIVTVVVLSVLSLTVFAQPTQPLATTTPQQTPAPAPTTKAVPPAPTAKPTLVPTAMPPVGTQNGIWVPQQLPAGWMDAGLTTGDAIFAERTAWTFADREEAIDFRSIGTMTAARFILTPGGKTRFAQNDRRVANDDFLRVVQKKDLIQSAVGLGPHLVKFQAQDKNQFVWFDVSFQLYQSQRANPDNPKDQRRIDGLEVDATHQPRIHHMSILLHRIDPKNQGADAPMGGSGWLVSNYGLDLPGNTPLEILQPI
ncbi:hypothetical protein KSF_109500 [Reticulibacter mediterranei]|uniref:Uncharacterized protein n=1 Tax=Reticulibacter mediterranei TaxID=2778369 RepID=A0A8J3J210_9CHLR|nr:hypothetical protein [Reticulibacter mediterranei]GHP00903.1 hypothetical protein KSF_109500 [Reticulibacter mediterranei]